MWTRQWEGDMEASYIAGKSVMMLHGPWVWDKALAAGSDFAVNDMQAGLPATPPAEGQDVWMQSALPPNIDNQWFIRAGNEDTPHWAQTQVAWNWFWSPEAIPFKAQGEGRWPLYDLDEPLDLKGPQFQAVLKHIGTEGGTWANAQFEQDLTGNVKASPFRKKGSKGVWTGRPTATTRSLPTCCPARLPFSKRWTLPSETGRKASRFLPSCSSVELTWADLH